MSSDALNGRREAEAYGDSLNCLHSVDHSDILCK